MDEKLDKILERIEVLEDNLGDPLKVSIRQALDSTEHTRKIDTIINILVFVSVIVTLFGVGNILLLWGLAK